MQIEKDIETRSFSNVYLLYGSESYLRIQDTNRLCNAITEEELNRLEVGGESVDENEIIGFAETAPFLPGHRLVRVKDSGFFKSAKTERIQDFVKDMPDYAVIVFSETEVDKRGKLFKAVSKAGHVEEYSTQSEGFLVDWGTSLFRQAGMNISRADMEYMLSLTGPDMGHLFLEVDKVASLCKGQAVVDRASIDAIVDVQVENHIFDMVEASTLGNKRRAMELYADLLSLKEPPLRILFLIARQYNQLLIVKELCGKGVPAPQIAKKAGMHPYAAKKLSSMAGRFETEFLKKAVNSCVELEESVKTGKLSDRLSVELALLSI